MSYIQLPLLVENLIKWYLIRHEKYKIIKFILRLNKLAYEKGIIMNNLGIKWNTNDSLHHLKFVKKTMKIEYHYGIKTIFMQEAMIQFGNAIDLIIYQINKKKIEIN